MHSQPRWAGHVARMSDERLPKKLLFGELQQRKCSNFTESIQHQPQHMEAVSPRQSSVTISCANACETNRTAVAEERKHARKNRANNSTADATIPCPHCRRLFQAGIGLTSHLRCHKARLPLPQDEWMVLVVPTDEQHFNK